MYDAVYLFAKALDAFLENENLEQEPLSCKSKEKLFDDGNSLINFIKTVSTKGTRRFPHPASSSTPISDLFR